MNQKINDPVNHPSHYCAGGIECIDAIAAALVCHTDPMAAWLTGQCLKYLWRWPLKGGVEDLRKTEFYLQRLIAVVEKRNGGEEMAAVASESEESEIVETVAEDSEAEDSETVETAAVDSEAPKEETGRTMRDVVAERWPDTAAEEETGRTLRDVVAERWPNLVGQNHIGGVSGCPTFFFTGVEEDCDNICVECWSRPWKKEYGILDKPNV